MNQPTITTIQNTHQETPNIKTITFHHKTSAKPGQFYMIWIPNVDEIPMSLSQITNETKSITFRKIGTATNALQRMKPGDKIGIRGPYGNGFKLQGSKTLFVAGGTGTATLAPAVEQAQKQQKNTTLIIGAKTKTEIFFQKRLQETGAHVLTTTDDGTEGFKGFATTLAQQLLNQHQYDTIYTCGPEPMMKTLLQLAPKTSLQASLERYMKCAIGLCGQCTIGPGLRVCTDGPIFDAKTLKKLKDFNVFRRDAAGRKIPI